MLIDGRTLHADGEITAAICIVGSGPAGLTLADELRRHGPDIVIVESGAATHEPWAQALNDGPIIGDAYAGLRSTRHRQLGGTINVWNTPVDGASGAKYAPLDPRDLLAATGDDATSGWPIDFTELARFYPRAVQRCGLAGDDFSQAPAIAAGRRPFDLPGDALVSKVYRFGRAAQFLDAQLPDLCAAQDVRLYSHLTACALEAGAGSRVAALSARTRGGATLRIRARVFVVAAGAIENARLLLTAASAVPAWLQSVQPWLGRGFMEHPRDTALRLIRASPAVFDRARFYDAFAAGGGAILCGRLAFADGAPDGLPNMSVTLLPRRRASDSWVRRLLGRPRGATTADYGWSETADLPAHFDAFRLLINLEQRPHADNRIVLADARDAFGLPRAALHWRWRDAEQDALVRLRRLIAATLQQAGLGRVEIDEHVRPDPNAHHHAGTTRMASSPQAGVVDRDGRVFGVDNLYVAGASVFPTAGFANPTLTIVALSCRLAAHLGERL